MGVQPHPPFIEIRNLQFAYPGASAPVLRIPALNISEVGMTAIIGPSGAGKSTLIELIAGTLREEYEGTLSVLGTNYATLKHDADRQRFIRRIGFIPQDYAILPGMTIRQFLEQDLTDAEIPSGEHEQRISNALEKVGIAPLIDRTTTELSGGQRQRIAIARMLARDVDIVIADEPTANVDPELVETIFVLFQQLASSRPLIVITHDPEFARRCDRTIILQAVADIPSSVHRRKHNMVGPWVASSCILLIACMFMVYFISRNITAQVVASNELGIVPCQTFTGAPVHLTHTTISTNNLPTVLRNYEGYSNGTYIVLAPTGWTCISDTSNIGTQLTVNPSLFSTTTESEGVEFEVGSGQAVAAYLECPFFPTAKALSGGLCLSGTDRQEKLTHDSATVVLYRDPPGYQGHGALSGNKYTDIGIADWQPYDLSSTTGEGFGFSEDCALPQSEEVQCTAMESFTIHMYSNGPPAQ